jgi:uncharacterized protein (DUF1501 family)
MDRRQFLRLALGAGIMPVAWRLWAAPAVRPRPRFVFVFLRGGYDALSALVPYGEPFYYEARPNIALAPPDPANLEAAVPLDHRWALHPSVSDALMPFWDAKQLAFVPFTGTGFVSRSHFQAQDWVELGQAPEARPASGSGFLNRLLTELDDARGPATGVSFTPTLPPSFHGPMPVANWPLSGSRRGKINPGLEELILAMYDEHALEDLVRDGLGLRREVSLQLQQEMQEASRAALPAGSFALESARMGRLLCDHPEYLLGFVDVGGWDTHAGQGAARGALSSRLRDLTEGLQALAQELGSEWQRTLVVVMSEFGRTFRENGSRGTDHGHGTTLWVLGGGIQGGAIRGEQGGLGSGDLHQDRDLPVLNEYRDVLAGLLAQHYGLGREALARVFPAASARNLGLL